MATRISHTTQIFQATAEVEEYIKIKSSTHCLWQQTWKNQRGSHLTPLTHEQHTHGPEKQGSGSSIASLWHSAKDYKAGIKVQ